MTSWYASGSLSPEARALPALLRRHWSWLTPLPMHPSLTAPVVVQSDSTTGTQSYAIYNGLQPVSDLREPAAASCRDEPGRIDAQELTAQLWAIVHADLRERTIQPVLDSSTALSYVEKGGGAVPRLAALAWQHTLLLVERRLDCLKPIWIPSEQNAMPDALSRVPLPVLAFFPEVGPGPRRQLWHWLQAAMPVRVWHLWPDTPVVRPAPTPTAVFGRAVPRATVLQLIAAGPALAFLVALPSHLLHRVARCTGPPSLVGGALAATCTVCPEGVHHPWQCHQ